MEKDYDFDSLLDELGEKQEVQTTVATETETEPETETKVVTDADNIPDGMLYQHERNRLEKEPEYRVSDEFKEVQQATNTYLNEYFDIQDRMRELKEELTSCKNTAKEEGVYVQNVHRAVRELKEELKETSQDAQNVEETKEFIRNSSALYSNIVAAAAV